MHSVDEVVCDHCGKTCQNKNKLNDHKRHCPGINGEDGVVHEWQCDEEGCDFIVRRKLKNTLPEGIRRHKE